jgi:hypothetical protein
METLSLKIFTQKGSHVIAIKPITEDSKLVYLQFLSIFGKTEGSSISVEPIQKMTSDTLRALKSFIDLYKKRAPILSGRFYIGEPDRSKRVCRFCKNESTDGVTFKKIAHKCSEGCSDNGPPDSLLLKSAHDIAEVNIYKCLCKIALSVINDDYLKYFDKTINWIKSNNEAGSVKLPKMGILIIVIPI